MFAINFIVCACYVLPTFVSANYIQDKENEYQLRLHKDFDIIFGNLDLTPANFKNINELSNYLNAAPGLKYRSFVRFLDGLKSRAKNSCDINVRADLILLKRILVNTNSPFKQLVHEHLISDLDDCLKQLGTDKDVIDFNKLPLVKKLATIKGRVIVFTQRECGISDKYCYTKGMDDEKFAPIAALIYGNSLRSELRGNSKKPTKSTSEFSQIKNLCKTLDFQRFSKLVPMFWDLGRGLGPNVDMIMYTLSLCRLLEDRDHLLLAKLIEQRGKKEHEPADEKNVRRSGPVEVKSL